MKNCEYHKVVTNEITNGTNQTNVISWTLFLRQMFVVTGVWVIYFSLGLSFGSPTIFITQMRKEANSSNAISPEMESWLTSVHGYSALPFVIIIPIASQKFGRKKVFIFVCFNTMVANIIFYLSTTTMHILISEMMQGVLLGSNMTLLLPICSEYSTSYYRGMIMTVKAVCFFWGVWVANTIGTFYHWKNIAILAITCSSYSLTAVFWPESPSWLALQEKYESATVSHHWLKGYDIESEKELEHLIQSQKKYREMRRNKSNSFESILQLMAKTITMKNYYYPLLIGVSMLSLYQFSGKLVCVMYAIQLINQITKSEEAAYMGMLILEGITILGMTIGCFVSKYLKRKTQLLSSSFVAVVSLYVISLYLYLINLNVVDENKFISLFLLIIFSVSISCGPLIIASPIFGEIVALQFRCSTFLILTFYSEILMATLLKLAPSVFRIFGLHIAFLFFAIIATIFIVLLYFYLPETKGKSLQEIQDFFGDTRREESLPSLKRETN